MQSKKQDYLWNSFGSFLQSAISPILLIFITRLNGIDDSGLFSFALSLSVVFWTISLWGGRTYQVSDVKQEFSTGGYIMVRLFASGLTAIMALILCIISGYDLIKTSIILLLVGFKIIESLADVLYGVLQVHNRLYIVGKSLTIKAIVGLICFVIVDTLTHNILYSSITLLVVNLITICLYDIRWLKISETVNFHPRNIKNYMKEAYIIMWRTMPVFLVMFLILLSLNIPRYFLDQHHPGEIGYFGIMAMPITLLTLCISFIIQPNIVTMARLYDKRKIVKFNTIVKKIIYITIGVGLAAVIITHFIGILALESIFDIKIQQFQWALLVMVIGAVANAMVSIYVNVLTVMRVFVWQCIVLFTTNIITALLSYLLVGQYAMMGAVTIFTAINFVQYILLTVGYRLHLKKQVDTPVQRID